MEEHVDLSGKYWYHWYGVGLKCGAERSCGLTLVPVRVKVNVRVRVKGNRCHNHNLTHFTRH